MKILFYLMLSSFNTNSTDPCITDVTSYCELDANNNVIYFLDFTYNSNCKNNTYDLVIVGGQYPNNFTADIITGVSHYQQQVQIQNVVPGQTYELYWGLTGSMNFPLSYSIEQNQNMLFEVSDIGCVYSPNEWSCCPELHNEFEDGGFDIISAPISSDFNQAIVGNTLLPAQYIIANNSNIASINSNWNVLDRTNCTSTSSSNFLVFNGPNLGYSGSSALISFNQPNLIQGEMYTICFDVKDLPQCSFNIIPEINLVHNSNSILQNLAISTSASDPCDWNKVQVEFIAGLSNDFSITLNTNILGDGNDLAIDNIAIHKKEDQTVNFTLNTLSGNSSWYPVQATVTNPADILGCNYWWLVSEVDSNGNLNGGSLMFGNSLSGWLTSTSFNGYNSTSSIGQFFYNRDYRVYFYVFDCPCYNEAVSFIDFKKTKHTPIDDDQFKLINTDIGKEPQLKKYVKDAKKYVRKLNDVDRFRIRDRRN